MVALKKHQEGGKSYTKIIILVLFVIGALSVSIYQKKQLDNAQTDDGEGDDDYDEATTVAHHRGKTRAAKGRSERKAVAVSSPATVSSPAKSFLELGIQEHTDKVLGPKYLEACLADEKRCIRNAVEPKCKTGKNHCKNHKFPRLDQLLYQY
jgi:hypothetical protein